MPATDAVHLVENRLWVLYVLEYLGTHHEVELAVIERERSTVAHQELGRGAQRSCVLDRLGSDVEPDDPG